MDENAPQKKKSRGSGKTKVISHLAERYRRGELVNGIVTRDDIYAAMEAVESELSRGNAANFLKDLIRNNTIDANWPEHLAKQRLFGRQEYGNEQVFGFYTYEGSDPSPWSQKFAPGPNTPITPISSLPINQAARALGRSEETWLTQVVANLRILEHHLAIHSPPELAGTIRQVDFLQTGMKTQPEIDCVYIAEYVFDASGRTHVFVTVEVKQINQRILDNQIREQVAKAFEQTKKLIEPVIAAVKPIAISVVRHPFGDGVENMIYVVEFAHIERALFEATYSRKNGQDALFNMPLEQISDALYYLRPAMRALGLPTKPKTKSKGARRKHTGSKAAKDE